MDLRIDRGAAKWVTVGMLLVFAAFFATFGVLMLVLSPSVGGVVLFIPAALAALAAEGEARASIRLEGPTIRKAWLAYRRTFDLRGTTQLRLSRRAGVTLVLTGPRGTRMVLPLMAGRARVSLPPPSLAALRDALLHLPPAVAGHVVQALDLQMDAQQRGFRDGETPFGRWSTYGSKQPDILRYLASDTR